MGYTTPNRQEINLVRIQFVEKYDFPQVLSAIEYRSVTSRKCYFQNILILALDPEKAL